MNQNYLKSIEWPILRGSIIFSAVCLSIGLLVFIISYERKMSVEEFTDAQQLALLSFNHKANKAVNDRKTYLEYLPILDDYMARGYIGEENRVLWIDILNDVAEKLKFPGLQYALREQEAYDHKGAELPMGEHKIVKSVMQISMSVFHEDDLFTLMRALDARAKGLFYIESCLVQRIRVTTEFNLDDANLNVQCELVWISLLYPERVQDTKVATDES